jgi:hypothetical protein
MAKFKNMMEIYKLLDKSNCRECNEKTCLAFAASVFIGKKYLSDCTKLNNEIINLFDSESAFSTNVPTDMEVAIKKMKDKIKNIDLSEAAERLGGTYSKRRLTLKIFGKNFGVDNNANFYTDLHVHEWITIPYLSYILYGKGLSLLGDWVPLRELHSGKNWHRLFAHRCEKPMKELADKHADLFEDMIRLFGGREINSPYNSDISLTLYPLPKIPILICYWKPENGMESDLNIFFDSTAEKNLNIESLYTLGTGLTIMMQKIVARGS